MQDDIAIKVENLSKVYKLYNAPVDRLKEALHPFKKKYHKDFYALNNINFEVKKGETLGIIGRNGAGKSTLLKIITGVLTQTSGSLEVNGKISSLLELGTGFNPEYTGMENIYFQGNIMGYSQREIDNKLNGILNFAEIGEFIYQPVKNYSSGMFARLAFAIAINVEPDVLIVDEALSVGDVKFVFKCLNKFKELQNSGTTILLVTHDVQTVKTFCKSGLWLKNGNLERFGKTEEVTNAYMRDIFGEDYSGNNIIEEALEKTVIESNFKMPENLMRWGSGEASITYFDMRLKNSETSGCFKYLETIIIKFTSIIIKDGFYPYLSFAFSLRNIKNLDLIAEVVKHNTDGIYRGGDQITVEFEVKNILPPGDYMLVLAIEHRNGLATEYIDYIENALSFKVIAGHAEFYSVVKPEIKSKVY